MNSFYTCALLLGVVLQVQGALKFAIPDVSDISPTQTVEAGSTVELQCTVRGAKLSTLYGSWSMEESPSSRSSILLTDGLTNVAPGLNNRYSVRMTDTGIPNINNSPDRTFILTIRDVRPEDAKKYTCEVPGSSSFPQMSRTTELIVTST